MLVVGASNWVGHYAVQLAHLAALSDWSDDQEELSRDDLAPEAGQWTHTVLGSLEDQALRLTWNITAGSL